MLDGQFTLGVEEEYQIVDPATRKRVRLAEDIRATIGRIRANAPGLEEAALLDLEECLDRGNDSSWLRAELVRVGSLGMLMKASTRRFLQNGPLSRDELPDRNSSPYAFAPRALK